MVERRGEEVKSGMVSEEEEVMLRILKLELGSERLWKHRRQGHSGIPSQGVGGRPLLEI